MQLIRCPNGHIYDLEKSKECPTCQKINKEQRKMRTEWVWTQGEKKLEAKSSENGLSINEQKTVPLFPGREQEVVIPSDGGQTGKPVITVREEVTQSLFSRSRGRAYVTGWLVATNGPAKGRDYRICHGMNWLGKDPAMDLCVSEDEQIADKNCALVYDDKTNFFFVVPASGAITRLNGETLSSAHELKFGDKIEAGKTRFEFIPFCREGHVWDGEDE